MSKVNEKDPRSNRTKLLLIQALIEIMNTKDANSISIRELTEKSGLSRATFYLHYLDMPDFLEKVTDDTIEELIQSASPDKQSDGVDKNYYTRFFRFVADHQELFRMFLGEHGYPPFRILLIEKGCVKYNAILEKYRNQIEKQIPLEILVRYIISAHTGLMEYWLMSGCKYSAEYMAKQVSFLTIECLKPIASIHDIIDLPI